MSVELGTNLPATTFTSFTPTIINPQLVTTNNTFIGTTALANSTINTTTSLTTNTAQTMTGSLTFNNPPSMTSIDTAGVIQIGATTDTVQLGNASTTLSFNGIPTQTITGGPFINFCQGSNTTVGGALGYVTGQKIRGGIADLTTATSANITITAGLYTVAPVVILTPTSLSGTPTVLPSFATYWVNNITSTGFTVNSSANGRRLWFIMIGN